MSDELELIQGTDNPFRDVGLSEPDTKLMKADLAAEIIRTLRERQMTSTQAATLAGVQEADIVCIRNADLDSFTIDQLVGILNCLDHDVEIHITFKARVADELTPGLGAE